MDQFPRLNTDGSASIMLRPCPTTIASQLFDPAVPFVWVVDHLPFNSSEWWELDLPICRNELPRRLRVRGLRCELLLDTAEFLEVAQQFDGGNFFQMDRPIPQNLDLQRLPEERIYDILRGVGLSAAFCQPHGMETAQYRTWDHGWMKHLLNKKSVQGLAFGEGDPVSETFKFP